MVWWRGSYYYTYSSFKGTFIHAHDFIDGKLYAGKRVLCIGGSYSAEDIALQCWKFGAVQADITHRRDTRLAYPDWPAICVEKPILTNINGNKVTFKDGKQADYDVIIKCTGYRHYFPFLGEGTLKAISTQFIEHYIARTDAESPQRAVSDWIV